MGREGKGHNLMNMAVGWLRLREQLGRVNGDVLTQMLLKQFAADFVELETPFGSTLTD